MSSSSRVRLSVIVPAYNEQKTIKKILSQLFKQPVVSQVVMVDDASTDKTAKIAAGIRNRKFTFVRHRRNGGKGKAIQTGLKHAKGNYILIQDADLEYDPNEIGKLIEPVKSGRAKVVFGSRFNGAHTNMFYWHFLGNKFLNFTLNVLYDTILSDLETCYKLVPKTLLEEMRLEENDFRIEPEIACKLLLRRVAILEVPISYIGRTYLEGKKITWKDGLKAFVTIVKLRFA
ncbi:MAG TPA: glycosyltransferase family 2 protein [Candidatus Saccharimonadia bacterium]|nr:glycosyltransferase family 2 protein [Candidatus Saccharimonadia bacterium]